jgi:adenylate cyclase
MEAVNARWRQEGRPSIRVRIGLHTAEVLVGNVGSSERLSYTVMGDGVNVAARLEGVNKLFGTTICVSESVATAAGAAVVVRPLRRVEIRGHSQEIMVYELLGLADTADPELQVRRETVACQATELTRVGPGAPA